MTDNILNTFDRVGSIAASVQRKLLYILVVGVIASIYLVVTLYSTESAMWWNIVKSGVVVLPVIICFYVYWVLGDLSGAPVLVRELADGDDGLLVRLKQLNVTQTNGLLGLVKLLRAIRREQGLADIFDVVSGMALVANPLFMVIAFLALIGLFAMILIAPMVLLF